MKAEELRIGNILKYHDQNVYVLLIDQNSAEFGYFKDSIGFCRFYADHECPQPIPLTEEWLNKLGPKNGLGQIEVSKDCAINPNGTMALFQEHLEDDLMLKLPEYVHQLQNLYHALTGTDLTIPVSEKPLSEGA